MVGTFWTRYASSLVKADTVTRGRRTINVYQGSLVCLEAGTARDRDSELTALFLDYYDPMRRLAYVMIGDGAIAEEIVMEAFEKAMSKWRLFSKADHPGAYLRQMVVNGCRSKVRRKMLERRVSEMFKKEEKDAVIQGVEEYGVNLDIWDAVQKLPERQRVCVVLRYLEDLSEPEIADTLQIPVGTVKSQLSRGRKKLGDFLGADFMVGGDS